MLYRWQNLVYVQWKELSRIAIFSPRAGKQGDCLAWYLRRTEMSMYHVSCEPLRIFWNDDTTCSTRVPCVRCLPRAGFLAFQPVVDNTRGTRVEQVVSSFQKILRGSQLTWCIGYINWPLNSYASLPFIYFVKMIVSFKSNFVIWHISLIMAFTLFCHLFVKNVVQGNCKSPGLSFFCESVKLFSENLSTFLLNWRSSSFKIQSFNCETSQLQDVSNW